MLTCAYPDWFADLENEISAVPEADTKPRLYCDSTFMQYMRGSDIVPNSGGKTLNQVYDKKYVCELVHRYHVYCSIITNKLCSKRKFDGAKAT